MASPVESAVRRRRWRLMLAYALILAPTIVLGAMRALEANNNSPIDWVDASFAPRAAYDEFCDAFGPGDTVVVSWPGCTLYETRLDTLVERLRSDSVFFDDEHNWLLHSVVSGRESAIAMTAPQAAAGQPAMTPDQAIDRLRPGLVGPDRRTTAVVVTFTAEGLAVRSQLVPAIRDLVQEVVGVGPEKLHLAGPVIDGLSVDEASQSTLARYAAPSAAIVFALCWVCLRSLRAAVIVFGLSAFCQAITLALVHYSGESMSALMIVLPPMMQVLAVAGGLHLTNYFFDSGHAGERGAVEALRIGWGPCALSAATTATGMASLMASELTPIRQFGAYAAAGVTLSTAVLLGLLPALYAWVPLRRQPLEHVRKTRGEGLAARWTSTLTRYSLPISAAGAAAIVVGVFYSAQIGASVRIETLFPAESRILQDYAWMEKHVGPLVPLDVVITLPSHAPVSERAKLTLLWHVGERLRGLNQFAPPTSAATLVAPTPDLSSAPEAARDAMIEQFLVAQDPLMEALGVKHDDGAREHWRLTVRTTALGDADYGELLASVKGAVEEEARAREPDLGVPVEATVTGIMPLVHEIQGQLLRDLLTSFAGALALITMTMTIVQAGVVPGLVAMASNVFPIAVYFGWLGWRGQPIDIGVVMTASVALGVAVDDTLHFLSFFQRVVATGASRVEAVRESLARCAPAMIQTSVACGVGLLAFAFSDFAPTRGFAVSMAALLALALLGDLVLLPALLICPAGATLAGQGRAIEAAVASPADPVAKPTIRSHSDLRKRRETLNTVN